MNIQLNEINPTLFKTLVFACEKHKNQRRKDSDGTPYINHPIGVANYITNIGKVNDIQVLQAALLHDTVEDTETTLDEIVSEFGNDIAHIVSEVTDDKSLPKVERKKLQVEHAKTISGEAKLVKLADKLYNLNDILRSPPPKWTEDRIKGYFVWAWFCIENIRGTNTALEKELDIVFSKMLKDKPTMEDLEKYYSII